MDALGPESKTQRSAVERVVNPLGALIPNTLTNNSRPIQYAKLGDTFCWSYFNYKVARVRIPKWTCDHITLPCRITVIKSIII